MSADEIGLPTVISRAEAAQCGLSRFYTGSVCKAGHKAKRFVSNWQCVTCNSEKARKRESARSQRDPSYRMYRNVQRRSGHALSGKASPVDAIGCDHQKLRWYIEQQFRLGMDWSKYGQWEVDHIVPLSAARSRYDVVKLCHFTNLQPLWKRENLAKGGA